MHSHGFRFKPLRSYVQIFQANYFIGTFHFKFFPLEIFRAHFFRLARFGCLPLPFRLFAVSADFIGFFSARTAFQQLRAGSGRRLPAFLCRLRRRRSSRLRPRPCASQPACLRQRASPHARAYAYAHAHAHVYATRMPASQPAPAPDSARASRGISPRQLVA